MTEESCIQAIKDIGNKIRELKAVKKNHEGIPELLPQLKAAKAEYTKVTGKDYDKEMKKKEKEAKKLEKEKAAETNMTEESCIQAIKDIGNKIRELKAVKKNHEGIPELLPQLKAAKAEYTKVTGKDYDKEMKKKEKEAKKLEKEKAAEKGDKGQEAPKTKPKKQAPPQKKAFVPSVEALYRVVYAPSPKGDFEGLPLLTLASLCFLPNSTAAACAFEASGSPGSVELTEVKTGASVQGDVAAAMFLCRAGGSDLYPCVQATDGIDAWLALASTGSTLRLDPLNTFLINHTFLAGGALTLADLAILTSILKGGSKDPAPQNVKRWMETCFAYPEMKEFSKKTNLLQSGAPCLFQADAPATAPVSKTDQNGGGAPLPTPPPAQVLGPDGKKLSKKELNKLAKKQKKAEGKAAAQKDPSAASSKPKASSSSQGSMPELENAEMGKVVTRFPPEPSGYLHIGHVKAVILNSEYAKKYNGKLIVRMDDTNPSKEKDEYADAIIEDLARLGVVPDFPVSHTSDFFPTLMKYADRAVKEGKAYMDNTPQQQMRDERMDGIDGPRLVNPLPAAENAKLWEDFKAGKLGIEKAKDGSDMGKWCLRLRISMQHKNKRMRDPVIYRENDIPHARTKTKYKIYPVYDWCAPIVDSIEGVTHAMRTTEYNDADELYHWIQEQFGLRKVYIHSFARIDFMYTVLSKRKLQWFVNEGRVSGWWDPRFPTVQGVLNRGMNVEALKNFMVSQGRSRRPVDMTWDKIWAENKKVIDSISPRFFGIVSETAVKFTLTNVPDGLHAISTDLHPKIAEMGKRVIRTGTEIYLEGDDMATVKEGEEITLMRWGNAIIKKIKRDKEGKVTSLEGVLHLEGSVKTTEKKVTWVTACDDTITMKLVEFDYLITKPKLEENEDFKDVLNEVTRVETEAIGDAFMKTLKRNDIIQLERRGYFRVESSYLGKHSPMVLYAVPDGKANAMSTLSTKLAHR